MYILCSGLMALVASNPITTRGPQQLYEIRNPNEIHVGPLGRTVEHLKVCEVEVRRDHCLDGYCVDMIVCAKGQDTRPKGPWDGNTDYYCKQEYYSYNGISISVASGCAFHPVGEEKHAKEMPNTKECVRGETARSLGINEVYFVQETVKIRNQDLQTEETITVSCSTYYKER